MADLLKLVPRAAIFVAGVAAGAIALARREGYAILGSADAESLKEVKRSLAGLEKRIDQRDAAQEIRLQRIEVRLNEHATTVNEHSKRLADAPSTSQIVAAMEQLLQKTMASLDERLSTQAHSIDVLKTTVSQTDSLLERVLESLDSLESYADVPGHTEGAISQPRAM